MARIPDDVIEKLKTEISLVRLVERSGIELKKQGKGLAGKCPFHDDDTPSLIISESKNVFHCFGCNAAGTVIDWVMKIEGVSFRHAAEILQHDVPALSSSPTPIAGALPPGAPAYRASKPIKKTTQRKLETLDSEQDDQALLNNVIEFYHQTLLQSPDALAYLDQRGLGDRALIERFKLGYANRSLAYRLPQKQYKAGKSLRTQLQRIGILRESGHEHLNGSLVVPLMSRDGRYAGAPGGSAPAFDEHNHVVQAYGRKIRDDLRPGTPKHLYLLGPHRGVFNLDGLRDTEEVILCEALIDALTFYRAGYTNVTASYGVNGFTDEHLSLFNQLKIKRILIAYDRDAAGDVAAKELAEKLIQHGIDCYRLLFPKGMDANAYACQVQPASKSLGVVIRSAEWMGSGKEPGDGIQKTALKNSNPETVAEQNTEAEKQQSEREQNEVSSSSDSSLLTPDFSSVDPLPAAAVPPSPQAIEAEVADHEITFNFGTRRYRVRGFENNTGYQVMKINLLASIKENADVQGRTNAASTGCAGAVHVDTFDLYHAKARNQFIQQAAAELTAEPATIKTDIGKILLKLELLQQERIQQESGDSSQKSVVRLTDEEHRAALALLRSPDLLDKIVADIEQCGLVGENNNALAGYLACVSRKLDGPLAIIVQSTSAAGKSALMDAVLAMMPIEDRVQYSAMTGQSLFYMGETNLKHKILAIAEEEGASQAAYALKLLQSEGELTIASTAKDPQTGRLETQEYRVEGPVMLFLTTTAIEIDDELLNRCLVLTINEDREQTQAIHRLQRQKRTLDGLKQKQQKKNLLSVHANAQRLLKPLHVVNPFAEQLTFLDDKTRTRRDHEKYLTLIDSIALLHQHQREIKTIDQKSEDRRQESEEKQIEYIEVTLNDIEVANRLAHEILGRTLDELPPQTRRLLQLIYQMVIDACKTQSIEQSDFRFSRRQIRDYSGWGNTQLKVHLHRLEELEYVLPHRGGRGQSFVYELLYQGEGEQGHSFMMGLLDVESLGYDKKKSGVNDELSGLNTKRSGSSRPQVGGKSGSGRTKKNGKNKTGSMTYENQTALAANSINTVQEHHPVVS
jgi:DNA primase